MSSLNLLTGLGKESYYLVNSLFSRVFRNLPGVNVWMLRRLQLQFFTCLCDVLYLYCFYHAYKVTM